ncbi:MAG: TraR/DksA family transcriptional regulator [bacterium]
MSLNTSEIEKKLRAQLGELRGRLESVTKDVSKSHSADWAEQAVERENDEVLDEIGNETRVSIKKINDALDRIAEGTYGICESCGDDINPGRLDILPETTLCIRCADK